MGRNAHRAPDPNGAHVRIYWKLLDSAAWTSLSGSAVKLYMAMRRKLTSTNNGNVEAVFSELRYRGFKSKTTLHKALRELEAVGLIAMTRQGTIAASKRTCSLYRFTDIECMEQPSKGVAARKPTHDYNRLPTVAAAHQVVESVEERRRAQAQERRAVRASRALAANVAREELRARSIQ